jgi:hypothetical protein
MKKIVIGGGASRGGRGHIQPETAEAYDVLDAINDFSGIADVNIKRDVVKRKRKRESFDITDIEKLQRDSQTIQYTSNLECFGLEPQVVEYCKYALVNRGDAISCWPVVRPNFPELIQCNPFSDFVGSQLKLQRPLLVCPNLYDETINWEAAHEAFYSLDREDQHAAFPLASSYRHSLGENDRWAWTADINAGVYSLEPFRPAPLPLLDLIESKSVLLSNVYRKIRLFDARGINVDITPGASLWRQAAEIVILPQEHIYSGDTSSSHSPHSDEPSSDVMSAKVRLRFLFLLYLQQRLGLRCASISR